MPSSWFKETALYGLCAAVVAVELTVLVAAFRPSVSRAYTDFFIERSTDCYIAEDAVPVFHPGTAIDLSDGDIEARCPLLSAGWKSTGEGLVKTKAKAAELRFRLPERPAGDLVLTLSAISQAKSDRPQPVEILANGEPIGSLILGKVLSDSRIAIPSHVLSDGDLMVRLVPGRPEPAPDGKPGHALPNLAIGLTGLRLDPV
jgi:hypothetical protein